MAFPAASGGAIEISTSSPGRRTGAVAASMTGLGAGACVSCVSFSALLVSVFAVSDFDVSGFGGGGGLDFDASGTATAAAEEVAAGTVVAEFVGHEISVAADG